METTVRYREFSVVVCSSGVSQFSLYSNFTEDAFPSGPAGQGSGSRHSLARASSSSSRRTDPLAEFYEAAKAERRREMVEVGVATILSFS